MQGEGPRRPDGGSHGEKESASIPDPARGADPGVGAAFARMMRQAGPFMAAASTLSGALVFGALAGFWLDKRLGTRPWLVLAGTLVGLAVGMYAVARVALRRPREGQDG